MKKKLFALVLAGAMISGFGLAACDNTTGGGTTPGGTIPGGTTSGGTTSEAQALLDSLAGFETSNAKLTFTGTSKSNYTYSYNGKSHTTTYDSSIYGEATVVGTDLDMFERSTEEYERVEAEEGETSKSERLDVTLLFKRGNDLYHGDLSARSDENNDYQALPDYTLDTALAEFTKDGSENYLESDDEANMMAGAIVPLALSGPALKLIKNLTGFVGNQYAETADGYTVSYNLISAGEELLDKAITLVDALDENTATVKDLYNNPVAQDLLGRLLKGITAAEVKDLASAVVAMAGASQEMLAILPNATGSALDYLGACLASAKFSQAIFGSEEMPALETLPLKDLLDSIGTDKASVLGLLRQIRQNVGWYIASAMTGYGDDASADSKFDADIVLHFTKQKVLSSITVDFKAVIGSTQSYPSGNYTQTSTTKQEIGIQAEVTFPETASLKSLKGAKAQNGYAFPSEPVVLTASRDFNLYPVEEGESIKVTRHLTFTFSVTNSSLTVNVECREDEALSESWTYSYESYAYNSLRWFRTDPETGEITVGGVQYYCKDDVNCALELHLGGPNSQSYVNAQGFSFDSVGSTYTLSEPVFTTLEA